MWWNKHEEFEEWQHLPMNMAIPIEFHEAEQTEEDSPSFQTYAGYPHQHNSFRHSQNSNETVDIQK